MKELSCNECLAINGGESARLLGMCISLFSGYVGGMRDYNFLDNQFSFFTHQGIQTGSSIALAGAVAGSVVWLSGGPINPASVSQSMIVNGIASGMAYLLSRKQYETLGY